MKTNRRKVSLGVWRCSEEKSKKLRKVSKSKCRGSRKKKRNFSRILAKINNRLRSWWEKLKRIIKLKRSSWRSKILRRGFIFRKLCWVRKWFHFWSIWICRLETTMLISFVVCQKRSSKTQTNRIYPIKNIFMTAYRILSSK